MPTLEWIGKDKVINHHQQVPYRVLEEKYTYNAEKSDNMIIRGDNLEALKALLPKYEGRIKCIYIDPPYNTGNEGWVYNDNVNDPKIRKWLGEVVGREGEDLSRHDKWLCMMYPRLKLLQRLLSDDGVIFISIDDTEYANLKTVCDEIFGSNCFVSNISWQRTYSTRNDSKGIVNEVEHILCYSKQPDWQPNKLPRTAEMDSKYKNPDNDYTLWRTDNAFAPGAATHQGMVYAIQHPFTGKIVLFQAQPRVGAESTTYDKIKATLVEAGIPKEEIAIKTGDKDELKNIDLLSPDCPIRYIITVNALKEGWDCPFAYVLATVANRTSSVDVEQILGRVLRLPYTQKNASNVLNISYVITSSADFGKTLDRVVSGLNNAGFTDKDYRAKDVEAEQEKPTLPEPVQMVMQPQEEPEVPEVNTSDLRHRIEQAMQQDDTAPTETIESDELLSAALAQNEEYEEKVNTSTETAIDLAPTEVRDKMNSFRINDAFVEEASALRFPQFMMEVGPSFFSDNEFIPLKLEHC